MPQSFAESPADVFGREGSNGLDQQWVVNPQNLYPSLNTEPMRDEAFRDELDIPQAQAFVSNRETDPPNDSSGRISLHQQLLPELPTSSLQNERSVVRNPPVEDTSDPHFDASSPQDSSFIGRPESHSDQNDRNSSYQNTSLPATAMSHRWDASPFASLPSLPPITSTLAQISGPPDHSLPRGHSVSHASLMVPEDPASADLLPANLEPLPPIQIDSGEMTRAVQPSSTTTRKRARLSAPSPKTTKDIEHAKEEEAENCCVICLDRWEKNGDHRIVCLPCGHLLGMSCAKDWLNLKKQCPMCKARATFKQTRILYGVPAELRVVENAELDAVKDRLAKEEAEHKKTRGKLEELKRTVRTYKTQLAAFESSARRRSSTGSTGVRVAASSSVVGSARGVGRLSVTPFQSSGFASSSTPMAAGVGAGQGTSGALSVLFYTDTLGESTAFAFDAVGSVVLSEKGPTGASSMRLTRVSIAQPNNKSSSTLFSPRCINDINVCNRGDSSMPYQRYIAAVSSDRTLRIFDSNLSLAAALEVPLVPMSCCWSPSHPHEILVGLQTGLIQAYDVRGLRNPLHEVRIQSNRGSTGVHTLAPLVESTDIAAGSVLAASPSRVGILSFGGLNGAMNFERISGVDYLCAGATTCGKYIALSYRRDRAGFHAVYDSIFRTPVAAEPVGGSEARATGSASAVIDVDNLSLDPQSAGTPLVREYVDSTFDDNMLASIGLNPPSLSPPPTIATELKLGPLVGARPLRGHTQSLRPLQRAAMAMLPDNRICVVSGDDAATTYGGTASDAAGARVWYGTSFGGWHDHAVNHQFGGAIRCVQSTHPPRHVRLPPLIGMLSSTRLTVFKTLSGSV